VIGTPARRIPYRRIRVADSRDIRAGGRTQIIRVWRSRLQAFRGGQ
jgi:hypothetical protein